MIFNTIIVIASLYYSSLIKVNDCSHIPQDRCSEQVYEQCPHRVSFSAKEIQTTQLYLNRRFGVTNPIRAACPINPLNPPCIRKDIKCLSLTEQRRLTNAWLQLYENGVIGNFTKIHNDYWASAHKYQDATRWHFWLINLLEKELQKIDPSVCMPYWNTPQDFANPEKSIVFDIFGHSGTAANDYCVADGPFAGVQCTFPDAHCLRRQWRLKPALDPWKGPEYHTSVLQMPTDQSLTLLFSNMINAQLTPEMSATIGDLLKYQSLLNDPDLTNYGQVIFLSALAAHFDTHLSIGGWNGDMSVAWAPNDPLFHIFHIGIEVYELFWQLSNFDDIYLVPKSYNGGLRFVNVTETRQFADIDTDTFNYYTDAYLNESFQFGYGSMCHLYDAIIEPINDIVEKNILFERRYPNVEISGCVPDVQPSIWDILWDTLFASTTAVLPQRLLRPCNPGSLPAAAQRLKNALSADIFETFFPKFASNNWTRFDHYFNDVSASCNQPSNQCFLMPYALPWNATLESERQYDKFHSTQPGDWDTTALVDAGQQFYVNYTDTLNNYHYCSPYVTQ